MRLGWSILASDDVCIHIIAILLEVNYVQLAN
jgi:hypothetical protein